MRGALLGIWILLCTGCWGALVEERSGDELSEGPMGPAHPLGEKLDEPTGHKTLPLEVEVPIFVVRLVDEGDVDQELKLDGRLLERTFAGETLGDMTWKALHEGAGGERWGRMEPLGSKVINHFVLARSFARVWGRRIEAGRTPDAYVVGYCLLDDSANGWTVLNAITWLPSWLLPLPLHSRDSGTFFVAIFDRNRKRVASRKLEVKGTYGGCYRSTWVTMRARLEQQWPAHAAAKVAYDLIRKHFTELSRK